MSAIVLDGKALATTIRDRITAAIEHRVTQGRAAPGLAVILVGDDEASSIYVRNKQRACDDVGMTSRVEKLPADATEAQLLKQISALNDDPDIHGILVQLPLPPHIRSDVVLEQIDPRKDVDGFHPYNVGRLVQRLPGIRACTPRGVMALLAAYDVPVQGRHAVVVGASNIVGRPMALELLLAGATVTICHRFTPDLEPHVRSAEILVVAIGKPAVVDAGWIRPGAAVVDVGINRTVQGKVIGDLNFATALETAGWISPVPGGVGPMTIAMLLENTLHAAQ